MNVSFFGRLTGEAELKTSQNGQNYTSFSVATQVRSRGQDGKNKSVFVTVSAFGKQGETIQQYFHKGNRIVVHGEVMDIRAWTGNDGQPRVSIDITMNGFDFVDTQAESAAHTAPAQGYQGQPQRGYAAAPQPQRTQGQGYAPQLPAAQPGYGAQPPAGPQPGYVAPPATAPAAAPQRGGTGAPWGQQPNSYANAPY
jgi:single-strand DNA-binding protein